MREMRACVLRTASEAPASWEERLGAGGVGVIDPFRIAPGDAALAEVGLVLADAGSTDAVERVRKARRSEPSVQGVIVASAEERPRVERQVLFASGLGEVWIVAPEEVDSALVQRAADVTRRRRRHRTQRPRLEHALAGLEMQATRRAVISDAYLASLLDASPDPILSVNEEGVILSWNPGAERVLGFGRTEAIGRPLGELLGTEISPPGESAPRRTVVVPLRFRRRSGEYGVGECILVPVEAAGRRVWAVIVHDLTEERRAQEMLEAQAAELEAQAAELEAQASELEGYTLELERVNAEQRAQAAELERVASARSRFYASMSHELRTPINAIIGYVSLVLEEVYGEVPDQQRQALERAHRSANHLLELISDVLDLAKIEAGRIDLVLEEVCVPALVEELLDTVRSLATRRGSDVRVESGGDHCIRSDPRRLRQILLNLLSNAVKFGGGKPITVGWETLEDGGLQIRVADRGRGIEPQHLDRIFEEFVQIEDQPDGGTGLGLPISRRLATLLGGALEVDSFPGRGSTFTLRLPAEVEPPDVADPGSDP
jgi:PAS domain S-box-containing protein